MIAAALFGDRSESLKIVELVNSSRFQALSRGEVDIITAAYTFERDVWEPFTSMGYSFSTPNLYGGLTFSGVPSYVYIAFCLA